jgi:hypothetical protein
MSGSQGIDDVVFGGSQIFMSVTNPASGTDPVVIQLTNLVTPLLQSAVSYQGPRDSHPARPSTLMLPTLSASPIRPPAWSADRHRDQPSRNGLASPEPGAVGLCFIGLLFCAAVSRRVIAKRWLTHHQASVVKQKVTPVLTPFYAEPVFSSPSRIGIGLASLGVILWMPTMQDPPILGRL